mgnify:CR=1 FL=1
MAALDGKITIGIDYRPCVVHIPAVTKTCRPDRKSTAKNERPYQEVIVPEKKIKALFHCWSHRSELYGASPMIGGHPGGQVSGTFAIVEYEDGTIHEVEPTQIRFVDNAMSEYVFQEDKGEKEKVLDVLREICPECGGNMRIDEGIVLTSNPPQYRLKCDKCGHIEYSGIKYNISDNYE